MKSNSRNHRCMWQTWVREGLEEKAANPVEKMRELAERVQREKTARRPAGTIDFKRRASGERDD